jgi:hypothetical protein
MPDADQLDAFEHGWAAVNTALKRVGARSPWFGFTTDPDSVIVGAQFAGSTVRGTASVTATAPGVAVVEAGAACIRDILGKVRT